MSSRSFEKRFALSAGGAVEVENPRGRILIKEGVPPQVRLVAEGINKPVTADDLRINLKSSKLTIKCGVKDEERAIDLHLIVPSGLRLKLKTEEGTVQVHAGVSAAQIETLSGDVILGIPVDDLKVEITWMEGYIRYGGPQLQRIERPTVMPPPSRGAAPPPAVLAGKIGQGQVQLRVRTLNGWVELGRATQSDRVVIGAVPAQPLSRAARVIASHWQSPLGSAIRRIEPRLEGMLESLEAVPPTRAGDNDEEQVVKLESPLVDLYASVTNAAGNVISGLTAEEFTVTEDGVKQKVALFATETTPFNLVLLLDVSGSTKGEIGLIKEAARKFIDIMDPSDKIAIILFARDVEVVAHLTSNRESLRQAITQIEPPLGSTALYDAIAYALVEEVAHTPGERNAVVVITDGRDSSLAYAETPLANDPLRRPGSFLGFNDLLAGVLQADAMIYPIAVENEAELEAALIESARLRVRADTHRAQEQLKQLAEYSGGRFYSAARLQALDGVYEQIAADLRTIYSLAYMPIRIERDGSWRQVEVSVSHPGARVRCRRGYFAR